MLRPILLASLLAALSATTPQPPKIPWPAEQVHLIGWQEPNHAYRTADGIEVVDCGNGRQGQVYVTAGGFTRAIYYDRRELASGVLRYDEAPPRVFRADFEPCAGAIVVVD